MSKRSIVDLVITVVVTLLLFLGLHAAVEPRQVLGESMQPTLHNGEYVMLDKISYDFGSPQRGDIIVFKYPYAPNEDYIKRVIGLPGDHVVIKNGVVSVNGVALKEPYTADPPDYTYNAVVPQGDLFVLGDNRDNSSDSHIWGMLPRSDVIGRAIFSYWPLNELTFLPDPSYPHIP
jgi:signal peptidase I